MLFKHSSLKYILLLGSVLTLFSFLIWSLSPNIEHYLKEQYALLSFHLVEICIAN